MKINCHTQISRLVISGLLSFLLLCVFSFQAFAKTPENKGKDLITIIPLNITAGENEQTAIRISVERFLLQRLNGDRFKSKKAEALAGADSDELNKVYTLLNSNTVDDRLRGDEDNRYLCGGNVVVLGSSVMADFFLYRVETGEKIVEHNASGTDIGNVLTAAEIFTGKVKAQLATTAVDTVEKVAIPLPAGGDGTGQAKGLSVSAEKIVIQSDKVGGEITSVVFSKFDEAGNAYAVYALKNKIAAMEIIDGKFVNKAEFKNKKHDQIIGLTSIDTDQDGVEELVVSNIESDGRTINSYLLKWEKGKFEKKRSNLKWIFSSPGGGVSTDYLYAQKHRTLKSTLDSGVFKVAFKKGQLVVPEKSLDLPGWVQLPGLSLNPDDDRISGTAIRPDNRLRVLGKNGDLFWESSDSFGGTTTYLTELIPRERDAVKWIWLRSSVTFADIYPDNNHKEIISNQNDDATNNLFSRVKSFKYGQITILSINDLSCSIAAQTEKVSGHISGFDVKLTESKNDSLLLYSVVQKGKTLLSDKQSFIVLQNVKSLKRLVAN